MCPKLRWDGLPGLFLGFEAPGRWLPLLQEHARLLLDAAPAVRVTSVPPDEWPARHYAEALELLRLVIQHRDGQPPASLIDVGSGGGFPGMVVAAILPNTEVWLVEPLQKRARLLEAMASQLALTNVHVVAERAETAGHTMLRETAEVVTARAVAPLPELLEYTAPLAAMHGIVALPKGSTLGTELGEAAPAMETLGVATAGDVAMRESISQTLRVAFFTKVSPSPPRYPRRPGMPAKRPL